MNNECNKKTCPWQGGKGLSGNVRRLIHNPDKILSDYISPGMSVLDSGCGMGYMAVAAATLAGADGKVILVDIQREMLDGAVDRMKKAGLEQRASFVQCRQKSLCVEEYEGMIDFAYVFMMVHETDDKRQLLADLFCVLRSGGSLLIAEPYVHVSKKNFSDTVEKARELGFKVLQPKSKINLCRAVVLEKATTKEEKC